VTGSTEEDRWTAPHCRVFRELFSLCGEAGAAASRAEPADVALALTSLAEQFAWHAELLFDLLTTRTGTDAEALVAHPVAGTDAALSQLAGWHNHERQGPLVGALARVVLPRLHVGVAMQLARTDALVDGPRVRTLTLVARDLLDGLTLMEPLAERAMADPAAFPQVAAGCADVERELVAVGVAVGFVTREERPEGLTAPVE
jgi:hypothetical protein